MYKRIWDDFCLVNLIYFALHIFQIRNLLHFVDEFGEICHLKRRDLVTVWRTMLLLCYHCDCMQQHYDVTQFEYLLWRHPMHEWVMNIHYKTWIGQGRFTNLITTPSKQWGVCDKKSEQLLNSLSLNMRAHMVSPGLACVAFITVKLQIRLPQFKQNHTRWKQYVTHMNGFCYYWPCEVLNSFVKLMKQIWNNNLDFVIPTLLNQILTPVYIMAWRWSGTRAWHKEASTYIFLVLLCPQHRSWMGIKIHTGNSW